MSNRMLILFVGLWVSCVGNSVAFGHAYLKTPTPRNNNDGIKAGPCGGVPRTGSPTTYQAGQNIVVEWAESIDHRGFYLFSVSPANDQNFNQYALSAVFDDQDTPVADRGDPNTHHQYRTTVTLPDISCDACTFQMVQVMCDNPNIPLDPNNLIDLNNPVFPPGCFNYYSCSDIRIVGGSGSVPPNPQPGSQDLSSVSELQKKPGFGCGRVGSEGSVGPGGGPIVLVLLPFVFVVFSRKFAVAK